MAQAQFLRHAYQMFFAYQVCAQFGEFALAKVWKSIEQLFCRDQRKNGITQKLELLVVSDPGGPRRLQSLLFTRLRRVSERLVKQLRARKCVAQSFHQAGNVM